jgi:hypothetical protein
VAELARQLGFKFPVNVSDRLSLLNLKEEYQALVANGQLTQLQGFEISRLPTDRQDMLFRALWSGCATKQSDMRQYANALLEAETARSPYDTRQHGRNRTKRSRPAVPSGQYRQQSPPISKPIAPAGHIRGWSRLAQLPDKV